MQRSLLLVLVCGAAFALSPMEAAAGQPLSPALRKLDISLGRWVFHGRTLIKSSGKPGSSGKIGSSGKPGHMPGTWVWRENCRWSPNHLYLECTFSNLWSGKAVESLVVNTYNRVDHSFWHYELYASGEPGRRPFIAPLRIHGNIWIESGRPAIPGKQLGERIVYWWGPPGHVKVAIENSRDGVHWKAVDRGAGVRQP